MPRLGTNLSLWGTVVQASGGPGGTAPAVAPIWAPGDIPGPGSCPPGSRGALSILGGPGGIAKPWIPSSSIDFQKIDF